MRIKKLLVPLAFSMLFNSGASVAGELSDASTEPTDCYKMAWNDLGLTAGNALKLCSGTTDTAKTIGCFIKAYQPKEDNGLGLTMGFAINLCKSNSEPFRRD
jgi:hypothetical protein